LKNEKQHVKSKNFNFNLSRNKRDKYSLDFTNPKSSPNFKKKVLNQTAKTTINTNKSKENILSETLNIANLKSNLKQTINKQTLNTLSSTAKNFNSSKKSKSVAKMTAVVNKEEVMKEFSAYKHNSKSLEKLITKREQVEKLDNSINSTGKRLRASKLITVKSVKKENFNNTAKKETNKSQADNLLKYKMKSKEKIYYNDIYKSKKYKL
jgi:hypothetical protein